MIGFYFLIFLIIAGPGMYIGGSLIIPTDLVIPIAFLLSFKGQLKKIPILKYLLFYELSIDMSLLVGFVLDNGIGFSSVLKGVRLSYVLLIPSIIEKYIRKNSFNEDKVFLSILVSAIASGLIGIIFLLASLHCFEIQKDLYFSVIISIELEEYLRRQIILDLPCRLCA